MATTHNTAKDLDWVATRAACTVAQVAQVFNELRLGIEGDIRTYNATTQALDEEQISATTLEAGAGIAISRAKKIPSRRVFVAIFGNRIEVHNNEFRVEMSACVAFNDSGRCILRLADGTELEQWQFRKRALESLFFGDK